MAAPDETNIMYTYTNPFTGQVVIDSLPMTKDQRSLEQRKLQRNRFSSFEYGTVGWDLDLASCRKSIEEFES